MNNLENEHKLAILKGYISEFVRARERLDEYSNQFPIKERAFEYAQLKKQLDLAQDIRVGGPYELDDIKNYEIDEYGVTLYWNDRYTPHDEGYIHLLTDFLSDKNFYEWAERTKSKIEVAIKLRENNKGKEKQEKINKLKGELEELERGG